jgi:glutamate formiminotransferase
MQRLRQEAAQHGCQIARTELIGLIPQVALLDYALDSLQLAHSPALPTLEHRLGAATGDFRPILFE